MGFFFRSDRILPHTKLGAARRTQNTFQLMMQTDLKPAGNSLETFMPITSSFFLSHSFTHSPQISFTPFPKLSLSSSLSLSILLPLLPTLYARLKATSTTTKKKSATPPKQQNNRITKIQYNPPPKKKKTLKNF